MFDLFSDPEEQRQLREKEELRLRKEQSMQRAILDMKRRYGKNAVLRGMDLKDGATAMSRNSQIGGHKA